MLIGLVRLVLFLVSQKAPRGCCPSLKYYGFLSTGRTCWASSMGRIHLSFVIGPAWAINTPLCCCFCCSFSIQFACLVCEDFAHPYTRMKIKMNASNRIGIVFPIMTCFQQNRYPCGPPTDIHGRTNSNKNKNNPWAESCMLRRLRLHCPSWSIIISTPISPRW